MLETYKATIHGDKIEWETDAPIDLRNGKAVEVFITIVEKKGAEELSNGKKMAEVLNKMAKKGGIKTIENPSEWQSEQRRVRNSYFFGEILMNKFLFSIFFALLFCGFVFAQNTPKTDEKAEAVIKKAVEMLGGDRYLQVKTQIGRGKYSILRENTLLSFQTFVDVIVFPDSERTEFKFAGIKNVQTNSGGGGWIFDGSAQVLNDQTAEQVEGFKRGLRASLDNLLRGYWRGKAELTYGGKREAGIGKRNDVVKLTFDDGFTVEFEFSAADGLPMKAIYKRLNPDNEEVKEEDRYAQFVDVSGIKTPYIIDHFTNGLQTSRINYESIEFNKTISDKIFAKPKDAKEAKKDIKF